MKKIRCAIYTRKSAEEGLEQEFNSLDAQREACAAYVASPQPVLPMAGSALDERGGHENAGVPGHQKTNPEDHHDNPTNASGRQCAPRGHRRFREDNHLR